MVSLAEISDRLEIQQLLVDYSTAIDQRRFDDLDKVLTPDAHIEMLVTKQQLLLDDVESLRVRLGDLDDEAAALRKEVAVLTDTSPSPHAVQQRMAKMLRHAVDEVSEMRAEARAEAAALVAAAEAEAEAESKSTRRCWRTWPRSETP